MPNSIGANSDKARAKYRRLARTYDLRLTVGRGLHRAVVRLAPRPGETVVDVGCGTGLSFELLARGVGAEGRVVGVELSPEMLRQAELRVQREGWGNITLINASAQEAELPAECDAALFVLTHDVMRSREALVNVLGAMKPGGRVVAAGSKRPPSWTGPLRAYVWLKARRYVTTFEGFAAPWSLLAELVPNLDVQPILLGAAYVASGTLDPIPRGS